jgi:hypothetical protein
MTSIASDENFCHPPLESSTHEWVVYPLSCYHTKEESSLYENSLENHCTLLLPPGKKILQKDIVASRLEDFMNEGMQHTVAAVILAHDRCSPRVLLLDVDTKNECFDANVGTKECIPDAPLLQTLSLPMFKYERWESSSTSLAKQLAQIIRIKNTLKDTNKSPYDKKVSCTKPDTTQSYDHVSSGVQNNTDNYTNQTHSTVSTDNNHELHSNINSIQIGSLLGVWCVPEFGQPPLPFIPSHVTRPKEQIHVFQVILPPHCEFVQSSTLQFTPRFVSFQFLFQTPFLTTCKSLGFAYAGIPSLLCRFSFAFMTLQRLEETDSKSNDTTQESQSFHINNSSTFHYNNGQDSVQTSRISDHLMMDVHEALTESDEC